MWPFDKLLVNKMNDLERTVEVLTGANQVLQRELDDTKIREANLLDKIFNITGVNRYSPNIPTNQSRDPISIGNRGKPWPQVRHALEVEAKEKYWREKKEKQEKQDNINTNSEGVLASDLDKMEKDILGE